MGLQVTVILVLCGSGVGFLRGTAIYYSPLPGRGLAYPAAAIAH